MTSSTVTQFLSLRDRQIIAEIIESKPELIKTIWIEGGITVWVQFTNGGRLAFDRDWFASKVAEVKKQFPLSQKEINQKAEVDLNNAVKNSGIQIIKPEYHLGYRSQLIKNGYLLGSVGVNEYGVWYYSRGRSFIKSVAKSATDAIALITQTQLQTA